MRIFLLVTGFVPYILFMRPKYLYSSAKAKKDFKTHKNGVLYISNHTKILDFYIFMFKRAPRYVHCFVAEVAYKGKFLNFLNDVVQNIKVDRTTKKNISPIKQALDYLDRNKIVLLFPEGKMEKNPGIRENFTKTFAYLSLETGKPIIPFYIDGNYGFLKRPTLVVGEAIYPNDVHGESVSDEEIANLCNQTNAAIKKLAKICKDHKQHKTKTIFTRKYWLMDFTKITSVPIFYLIFPTKRYYVGDRKKIRKALKYNALLCSNHCGMCDAMFMFMFHMSRRVRILTAEEVWCSKFLSFVLDKSGMIKYHRVTSEAFDFIAFKECIGTLNGRGVVMVFPEGHINFDGSFDDSIKAGAATMSLMTDTPIIPFIFVTPFKYFKFNRVVYGDPIYPSDYADKLVGSNAEKIEIFNEVVYSKMKELYDYALTKRPKNFDKKKYFKDHDHENDKETTENSVELEKGDKNEQAR